METIKIIGRTIPPVPSTVICSNCARVTADVAVSEIDIYFPNRRLRDENGKAIACENCKEDNDMVIFGEQYVSCMRYPEMLLYPQVIENNRIHSTKILISTLREAIRLKMTVRVKAMLGEIDKESSWSGIEDLKEEWDLLVIEANKLG